MWELPQCTRAPRSLQYPSAHCLGGRHHTKTHPHSPLWGGDKRGPLCYTQIVDQNSNMEGATMLDEELARARVKEAIQKGLLAQHDSRSLGRRRRSVAASLRSVVCLLLTVGSSWLRGLQRAIHLARPERPTSSSHSGRDAAASTQQLAGRWCGD